MCIISLLYCYSRFDRLAQDIAACLQAVGLHSRRCDQRRRYEGISAASAGSAETSLAVVKIDAVARSTGVPEQRRSEASSCVAGSKPLDEGVPLAAKEVWLPRTRAIHRAPQILSETWLPDVAPRMWRSNKHRIPPPTTKAARLRFTQPTFHATEICADMWQQDAFLTSTWPSIWTNQEKNSHIPLAALELLMCLTKAIRHAPELFMCLTTAISNAAVIRAKAWWHNSLNASTSPCMWRGNESKESFAPAAAKVGLSSTQSTDHMVEIRANLWDQEAFVTSMLTITKKEAPCPPAARVAWLRSTQTLSHMAEIRAKTWQKDAFAASSSPSTLRS